MKIEELKTKNDYLRAMKRFEKIFQAKQGTVESEEADALAIIIKDYEDKHFLIENPNLLS